MKLTTDKQARKDAPVCRGFLDYFPLAVMAVAELSRIGNDQHNPGEPIHWAKEKSSDEADSCVRHLMERGTVDDDGVRHSTKAAWRAMANLERELEALCAQDEDPVDNWWDSPVIQDAVAGQEIPPKETPCFGGESCSCGGRKDGGAGWASSETDPD